MSKIEFGGVEVKNPLYEKGKTKVVAAAPRQTETSAFANDKEGVCPKCQNQMGKANLGINMGHAQVWWCNPCRVAEPIKNPTV